MKTLARYITAFALSVLIPSAASASSAEQASSDRKVVLVFKAPEGSPPPEGTITVTSLEGSPQGRESGADSPTELPVSNGRAELTLRTPNKLVIRSATFPRHALRPARIEIPPGAEPLAIELKVEPAGSLNIRLFSANGKPAVGWSLAYHDGRLDAQSRQQRRGARAVFSNRVTDTDGRFAANGLPLNTEFRIIATQSTVVAISPAVRLEAGDPVRVLEWTAPEAQPYRARFIAPDGSPIAGVALNPAFRLEIKSSSKDGTPAVSTIGLGLGSLTTDSQGGFTLPLNFETSGFYELSLAPRKTWQPAVIKLDRDSPRSGEFTVAPGHILSGRLLDLVTRQPVSDVELSAMLDLGSYGESKLPERVDHAIFPEGKTDAAGRFRFSTFPPGHYRLQCPAGKVEPAVVTLPAPADAPTEFLLTR